VSAAAEEKYGLVGKYRIWIKTGAVRYLYHDWSKNLKMDLGIDAMGKRLGNLSGGGYVTQIGVGDSTTPANSSQTDLQASTNKLWKTLNASTDVAYVRPTLFAQVSFGYTEANWVWNELGIRDNNNVMWARQVDSSPLSKTSSIAATVEWQFTIS